MPELQPWMPRLLFVAFGLPLLVFAFGWAVLRRARHLDAEERFATAWGIGIGVIGITQVLAFMLRAHPPLLSTVVLGAMVVVTLLCYLLPAASPVRLPDCGGVAGLWLLGYLHILFIQVLLREYMGSFWYGDWKMHYDFAQVFLGTRSDDYAFVDQYTLASRTPLFNAASGFVLSLTGDEFFSYQTAATWLNWLFPVPLYLLVRDRFGRRAGLLALLLMPLNLWLLHLAWFTWTKLLTAYYLLLALHFYLRFLRSLHARDGATRVWFLAFWACGMFAFLTHQVALVYLVPLLLHAAWTLWRHRSRQVVAPKTNWVETLAYLFLLGAIGLFLAGGWYTWVFWRFGPAKASASTPTMVMATNLKDWALAVLCNLGASFFPVHMVIKEYAEPWGEVTWFQAFHCLYFSLATGALTISLTLFLLVKPWLWLVGLVLGSRRARRARDTFRSSSTAALWLFSILGCLGGLLLHPSPSDHGVAHCAFFPSVMVWMALAWGLLSRAPRWVCSLVVAGMAAELGFMLWSHIDLLYTDPSAIDSYLAQRPSFWAGEDHLYRVIYLANLFEPWLSCFVLLLAQVQAALVVLLVRWLWCREGAPGEAQAHEVFGHGDGKGIRVGAADDRLERNEPDRYAVDA
jgi:hypothetical protein